MQVCIGGVFCFRKRKSTSSFGEAKNKVRKSLKKTHIPEGARSRRSAAFLKKGLLVGMSRQWEESWWLHRVERAGKYMQRTGGGRCLEKGSWEVMVAVSEQKSHSPVHLEGKSSSCKQTAQPVPIQSWDGLSRVSFEMLVLEVYFWKIKQSCLPPSIKPTCYAKQRCTKPYLFPWFLSFKLLIDKSFALEIGRDKCCWIPLCMLWMLLVNKGQLWGLHRAEYR